MSDPVANSVTAPVTPSMTDLAALESITRHGAITHLPVWPQIQPERVAGGLRQLLAETEAAFDGLEAGCADGSVRDWAGLMDGLERMQDRLGRVMGAVLHLTSVKYSDTLQAAYDAVRPEYVALVTRIGQSRPVYDAMIELREHAPTLTPAQRRILDESIRSMERGGVHLTGSAQARYQAIGETLAELSNRFQTNLVKEEKQSRLVVADPEEVVGVPAPVLAMAVATALEDGVSAATAEAGPWHFVINAVNYMAVVQHARHRGLRERFYRAFRARGVSGEFDNRPVLSEILCLRQEQAQLVGFASHAQRSIDAKMAPNPEAVWDLLGRLERAARPAAAREFAALAAFAASEAGADAGTLEPWDVPFWSERQREALYDYDSEALREYFQMPRVMAGLFGLIHKLYDVEIVEIRAGTVPTWDDSVAFYEVRRHGQVIAGFYMDPYARPGEKRGGAWMNTVVDRTRLLASDGRDASLPVALFVMNGRPPAAGEPALMSLDEVRTLFHEFGHATQHMFTLVDEGGASGMNLVEWDAVELASQFNEYWMEHKPFLRAMTAHYRSGEPLPDALIDRVIASRNFMVGNATLRQLFFAKTDLRLHEIWGLPDAPHDQSPFDIERQIARDTLLVPLLPDESQLPAFGHLFAGGYAAGYYSYKWAEVLAADAFAAFREVGLDDESALRQVAERFRETVLGLGGSLPAIEVYRLFRGRDPSPDALLLDQGLLDA
ncbi:MAG: M3 family metallopeptidase [Pseudomonadales bacterium]